MIEESPVFDNQYVLSRIEENKNFKQSKVIQELKQIAPLLNDEQFILILPFESFKTLYGNCFAS